MSSNLKTKKLAVKREAEKHISRRIRKLRTKANLPKIWTILRAIPTSSLRNLVPKALSKTRNPPRAAIYHSQKLITNSTMMIPLKLTIKQQLTKEQQMIWILLDLQTKRSNICKILFSIKMELTHTLTTPLNIRRPERDFKTESQLLEADKERRVTKKSSNRLSMNRMLSLNCFQEIRKYYRGKMPN